MKEGPISETWMDRYLPTKRRMFVRVLGPNEIKNGTGILEVKCKDPEVMMAVVVKIGRQVEDVEENDIVLLEKMMYAEDKDIKYLIINEDRVISVLEDLDIQPQPELID